MEQQLAPQDQEFKNDEVRLTVHKQPACRIEFRVNASPKLVHAAHKQAVRAVAKEVSLPGFRKGKAPDQLVIKNFSEPLDKKWQEEISHLAFRESEKLVKIFPLNREAQVSFKMESHSLEEGAKLLLSFETEPEPPSIDPSTVSLKAVKRPEVNDEKVAETIRQTQLFFAQWTRVADRPAEYGDFVILDVDLIDENKNLFSNTRFEVTEKSMAEWMRKLVLGLSVGESIEGLSVADENAPQEEKDQFPPKKARVALKAIESADIPPLDDDFAKKLGVPTVEEMHKSIAHLLNKQADDHVKEGLRDQVGEYILANFPFELPVSLIEKETQFRMRQLLADKSFHAHWNALPFEEKKKVIDSIFDQSKKAVQMFYICRKIISDAHISISPQDVPPPPRNPLEALFLPHSPVAHHAQPEVQQAEVVSRILLEKAEDHIISHSTITP